MHWTYNIRIMCGQLLIFLINFKNRHLSKFVDCSFMKIYYDDLL